MPRIRALGEESCGRGVRAGSIASAGGGSAIIALAWRVANLLTIDLHAHSDRSDGALAPQTLIARGATRGLRVLALTDHDSVAGIGDAAAAAREHGIALIAGVEISVSWGAITIHVLGLRLDPLAPELLAGLAQIRARRSQRAKEIARRLERDCGLRGVLEAALAQAADEESVSRVHFARHLVAAGVAKDVRSAFRRYLGDGGAAFVRTRWAALDEAVGWIRRAGGVAVLAHPGRYGLRPARLHELCARFKALGGEALEVLSASHTAAEVARLALFARELDLLASAGSDFHAAGESWLDLGALDPLPRGCVPVWRDWPECRALPLH